MVFIFLKIKNNYMIMLCNYDLNDENNNIIFLWNENEEWVML